MPRLRFPLRLGIFKPRSLRNPYNSCREFFHSQESFPVVVVLLVLLFLSVLNFAWALQVIFTEKLVSTAAKENWDKLAHQLNNMNLCPLPDGHEERTEDLEVSFPTLITVDPQTIASNVTMVTHGIFALEDWQLHCTEETVGVINFKAIFDASNASSDGQVCALLWGPQSFLPNYTRPACDYYPHVTPKPFQILNLSTAYCASNESITKLKFDSDNNHENFAIYMSEKEKEEVIAQHGVYGFLFIFAIFSILVSIGQSFCDSRLFDSRSKSDILT